MARAFAICTQKDITVMSHAEDMEISPWDYLSLIHICINNAMGGAQSVPSAVFSSDTGAAAAPASNAAPAAAPAEKKAAEEESSDTRYYDELQAILNKRK